MTEDHFPPEVDYLPGDSGVESSLCPECDRHVVSSHDHAESCSEWRGNQEADS